MLVVLVVLVVFGSLDLLDLLYWLGPLDVCWLLAFVSLAGSKLCSVDYADRVSGLMAVFADHLLDHWCFAV